MTWNPIIIPGNTYPSPSFYIESTKKLNEYIKNTNTIDIVVNNSKLYDGDTTAMIHSSRDFPTYRPNFYDKTGYLVITLNNLPWKGYPMEKNTSITVLSEAEHYEPQYERCENTLSHRQITLILFCIIVVFMVLLAISRHSTSLKSKDS